MIRWRCAISGFLGGIIGGIGSIFGGLLGSGAASDAASAQVQAAEIASQTQLEMFHETQQSLLPYLTSGYNSLNNLNGLTTTAYQTNRGAPPGTAPTYFTTPSSPILNMLGFGGPNATRGINSNFGNPLKDFQGSPGFNFQEQQGVNAITNAGSRTGGGGNMLKALQSYGTGLGNQDWYNYLNQLSGAYGNLVGQQNIQSGAGQNAATNLGGFSQQVGQSVGQNIIGAGNAQAAGIVGSANALAGGLNGVGSNFLLSQLMSGGGGGGGAFDPNFGAGGLY